MPHSEEHLVILSSESLESFSSFSSSSLVIVLSSERAHGAGCSREPHTGHGSPAFNLSLAIIPDWESRNNKYDCW